MVAALVGFTSSAVIVLAGLRAVGATPAEATSGLLAVSVTMGLGTVWLSRRHRIPVALAWSTPGAALMVTTGTVDGGWPAAVGSLLVVGVLVVLTGLLPWLGRLVAAIPVPLAQAMLAGVLLGLCLEPVLGLVEHPALVAPPVVTWLVLLRWQPRWAVPGAFVVVLVTIGLWLAHRGEATGLGQAAVPHVVLTAPALTGAAVLSLAVPLYVVTMASQNVPGVAVLGSFGYTAPWRESMGVTGVGTLVGATAGGQVVNLAAITAALVAGPATQLDPRERWRAAQATGVTYLVLALLSAALAAVVTAAPEGVTTAVGGLALLGTLATSLRGALEAETTRVPAVVTFVVAASGITALGIGSAFWALVAGLVTAAVLRARTGPTA